MSEIILSIVSTRNTKQQLEVYADPSVFCLTTPAPQSLKSECKRGMLWLWVQSTVMIVVLIGFGIAVWSELPDMFAPTITKMSLFSTRCQMSMSSSNPWPIVVLLVGFLFAFVALCWIGSRHAARIEKMAVEERKQRFDMRRFIVEKAIECAEMQIKTEKDNTNKYSFSIVLNKSNDSAD